MATSIAGIPSAPLLAELCIAAEPPFEDVSKSSSFNDEDKICFQADAEMLGIVNIMLGGLKWLGRHLGGKLGERLAQPLVRQIKRLIPKPPTPKETLVYETLYDARSFSNGVARLLGEWPDMKPTEAIKHSFDLLFRFDPHHPLAKINPDPFIITAHDINIIAERYGISPMQAYSIARLSAEEHGFGQRGEWSLIFAAIAEAKMAEGPATIDPSVTESQQPFLKEMRHDRIMIELDAIKDVLKELSSALKATSTSKSTVPNVKLNQFDINISKEVMGKPMGRFTISKLMDDLAEKIASGSKLTKTEEEFIVRLVEKNPVVQKIIDARTNHADIALRGTNLALKMTEQAQLGEYPWFLRILKEVAGREGPMRVGIIVQNEAGKETARFEFNQNEPRIGRGPKTSLYVEGEPHPVSPLSFEKGNVFVVKGNAETIEDAVMITDGRSRSFFISKSDTERYRRLATEVTNNRSLAKSEVGRAYLRFFNRLQAIRAFVHKESFQIESGSPSEKISRLATKLARQQWSVKLEQTIDWLLRETSSKMSVTGPENTGEAEANVLNDHITRIRKAFIEHFKSEFRGEFKKSLRNMEMAIIAGDPVARNAAVAEIKALMAQQLGEVREANLLALDLYEEVAAWREVDNLKRYINKEPPERLRNVVVARGVNKSIDPTLSKAREYATLGSTDRAFLEYDRLVVDDRTPVSDKIIAQAEKARLSVEKLQFQRAKRAVDWIDWMKAIGKDVPPEAAVILENLPPLNGGSKVVVRSKEKAQPRTGESATRPATPEDAIEIYDPNLFKPAIAKNFIRNIHKFSVEIGGPTIFGALTFLCARDVVGALFGKPDSHLEAVAQGYSTIATAVVIEKTLQVAAEKIFKGYSAAAGAMGLKSFFGGLGASAFIYKGIEGTATNLGMSEKAAEITGLVGTGVVYGAWKPAAQRLLAPEIATRFIANTENLLSKGGLVYLIADAAPTLAEAVYNQFDEPASVGAREEWYSTMKKYRNDRAILGDADDVAWYDRIGNSLFNTVDIFVPAAWHKFVDPVFDENVMRWQIQCEWKLKNGYPCG